MKGGHSRSRSHSHSRSRRHHRKHRGGSNAPNPSSYSSGASYGMAVNGTGNSQYDRVFSQSGPDAKFQSNTIVGVQGQRAGSRRGGSRKKRGGLWGQLINQALVPFSILGMQQSYRRKKHGGKKTHKRRH